MNITHVVQDIIFEWDSRKAASNRRKHGISFETACQVFFDPFLQPPDEEEEFIDGELREKVIGMTADWQLLYVIYVMQTDTVRLISARPVTTIERKRYEDG